MDAARLGNILQEFMRYSFNAISNDYRRLTPTEQKFCSEEEFKELAEWAQNGGSVQVPNKGSTRSLAPYLVTINPDMEGEREDHNDGWAIVNAHDARDAAVKASNVFKVNGINPAKHFHVYVWMEPSRSMFCTLEYESEIDALDCFNDDPIEITL